MHTLLHTILNRIATGRLPLLNAAEAVTLALLPEQDNLDILAAASAARAAFGPDAGASCGIVNAKSGEEQTFNGIGRSLEPAIASTGKPNTKIHPVTRHHRNH